jgi:hypothetical protein
MIKGEILREKPETTYRKLSGLNQSLLCTFADNPANFYRQVILGEEREDEDTVATLVGGLSDFYILDCDGDEEVFNQRFDEQFALFQGEKGSGQVFILADELFKIAKKNLDENGVIKDEEDIFTTMFQEAFLNTQAIKRGKQYLYSKKDWKKGLEDFDENGRDYYNTLINNADKKVVTLPMIQTSKRIRDQLFTDENLQENFINSNNYEVLNKFPIEFKFRGWD